MFKVKLSVIVLVVFCLSVCCTGDVVRNEDICGPHNGRRLYLELGDQGILRAENVSFIKNLPQEQQVQQQQQQQQDSARPFVTVTNSSHDQCMLELVTCPSCVITLTFTSINLQHHCGDGGMTVDSPCRCDYVWISEPPYEDVSGTPFCGHYAPITYRSNTRTLSIALLYSQSHQQAFTIEYTAERNRMLLKGSNVNNELSKSTNNTSGGILMSPFFPSRYPRDLGMEYIITCPTETPSCRVRILFSDFQLATVSIMEFYDWNGQRLDVSSGARFRPPIIVSSGPSLLIRFYANGGTGLGYKAFYSFVIFDLYDKYSHPITDCGGYVENLGGAITMMDMVGDGVKTFDCVWLIRPPKNFLHMKTHIYLKVITFAEMAGNTELIIKQGPTSALMPLELLRHPVSQLQPPKIKEHISPVTSGFHVSLRGSFGPNSRLAIAYAAFSYMDCFTGSDFLCSNHRCISSELNCDGFDHCGDNSDEPSTCLHDWDVGLEDRKWQQNKANYYFPKIDQYPDLKTATLVFVASSLGLIVLISALIILLYRVGARARQQRELQSRLRTISELLVLNLADGARIDEVSVTDDPPVYEAPPNYDEVIKLGMEDETSSTTNPRRKKRRTPKDGHRSRSIPSSSCSCEFEPQLTINIYEDGSSDNRSGTERQEMPQNSNTLSLPESPPPPYVTPPGTRHKKLNYPPGASLPGPSRNSDAIGEVSGSTAPTSDATSRDQLEPNQVQQQQIQQPSHVQICRGDCRAAQARRSRGRDTSSKSLPTSRTASASPSRERNASSSSSTSVEADNSALGAYPRVPYRRNHHPQSYTATTSTSTSTATNSTASTSAAPTAIASTCCNVPQSMRSSDASTCTSTACAPSCASAHEQTGSDEQRQPAEDAVSEHQHHRLEVAAAAQDHVARAEVEAENEEDDDPERAERTPIVGCICEGACGCASSGVAALIASREEMTRAAAAAACQTSRTLVIRKNSVDDSPSAKSRIIRLLAGSRSTSKNSCSSFDSAHSSVSTICSRDSRVTKISSLSTYSSIDRLYDDIDIVSETTSILGPGTLANTPGHTPNRFQCVPLTATRRSYSSCDVESLYESIKVLDSFLAQRSTGSSEYGASATPTVRRTRPMTVMLFGTPGHQQPTCTTTAKVENGGDCSSTISTPSRSSSISDAISARIRIWRSTDDALANNK